MFVQNTKQLMERAREVTLEENSPFHRFYESAQNLAKLISPYMRKMETPEDEVNRLVGHFGLMGETNNSINHLLMHLKEALKQQSPKSDESALQKTFLLSTMEHHGSQYSHVTHSGENVIAACNRIIGSIEQWTNDHAQEITPKDRLAIARERTKFAESLDEIYVFIQESRTFFETFDVPVKIPERYKAMLNGNHNSGAPANHP